MNKTIKQTLLLFTALLIILLPACSNQKEESSIAAKYESAKTIILSKDHANIDGKNIEEFDYTWHCDPGIAHDEVKNAPAEYYTGEEPETDSAVYIDHELYYFPSLPEEDFKLVKYDGEDEWAYYYTDGENNDYIFATLPYLGNSLPSDMMHTEEEAENNKVLHITEPGTYILEGEWNGQIWVDLGDEDETFTDDESKIVLVLNGVDISCDVAPGIVFYSAYECDNEWEDRKSYSENIDTTDAGVTVVIADNTENTVSGKNVFRMLKTAYKDENSTDEVKTQKKMRKTDGALYSYVSMNIEGNGSLTVNSGFEGIDSELHLSFNGGNITINSQDDGINVNEDNVSVVSFNGGTININAALGAEGDGVDSNGYVVVNGTNLNVNGIRVPDNALDSECGIYYKSGTIKIDGEEQHYNSGDVFRETGTNEMPSQPGFPGQMPGNMQNPEQPFNNMEFDIEEFKKKVAELDDNATLDDVLRILGMNGQGFNEPNPGMSQPPAKP